LARPGLSSDSFGLAARKSEIFEPIVEIAHFPKTEQLVEPIAKPGPNFTRNFDAIPNEPGVLCYNDPGMSQPGCIRCPDPQYSDAARKAKIQGKAVLSVLVTTAGRAPSIYLLKGAPMDLTAQAIRAVKSWEFRPAQKTVSQFQFVFR
jgi:TonB family protein